MSTLRTPTSPHKTPSSPDNKGWKFLQPNTGYLSRSHSLDVVQREIEGHRFAVAGKDIEVDLSHGWQMRFLDEICRQNPNAPCNDNPQDPNFIPPHVAQGRALWKELHDRAEQDNDPFALRDWFSTWVDRIPDYTCRCRSNALALLNEIPPDFSREGFKGWAIRFHDAVNVRLGKAKWGQ